MTRITPFFRKIGDFVRINDVTMRDGIQGIKNIISVDNKVKIIDTITDSGIRYIEIGTLGVSQRVPQFINSKEVDRQIYKDALSRYPMLVFNRYGLKDAIDNHILNLAFVTSPSIGFCKENMNKSPEATISLNNQLMLQNKSRGGTNRLYISTTFSCPVENIKIKPERIIDHLSYYRDCDIDEYVFSDTDATLRPEQLYELMKKNPIEPEKLALHLHHSDYNKENINIALKYGIRSFDGSLSDYGGCIIMDQNHQNIDLIFLVSHIEHLGFKTDIDLTKLIYAKKLLRSLI